MSTDSESERSRRVWIWGLPLAPLTLRQTLDEVDRLVQEGTPSYFITANLHYAMLTAQDGRLPSVNDQAAFILADGMPLVWASRWKNGRLPERVAGADLLPALCERAAAKGHRVFFLGGSPGVGQEAAANLCGKYPGLQIVGIEAPRLERLSAGEHAALILRIRDARPHLLFAALGQPKGELWLQENCRALGVPVCAQVGASLDFAAGRVKRAPHWVQRLGLEWAYRLYREPSRLFLRYARNGLFILRMCIRDAISLLHRKP